MRYRIEIEVSTDEDATRWDIPVLLDGTYWWTVERMDDE